MFLLERFDNVHWVEHGVVSSKETWMFGRKLAINDDPNDVCEDLDDSWSTNITRWNGVTICLVTDFGELRDTRVVGDTCAR
jgi:hypothetical protein